MTEPIVELTNADTARYRLHTESGTRYLIDLDAHTLVRCPEYLRPDSSHLRRDGIVLELLSIERCRVGERAVFMLRGVNSDPEIATQRATTPVVSIERLGDDTRQPLRRTS
jgi:hypothetical protein